MSLIRYAGDARHAKRLKDARLSFAPFRGSPRGCGPDERQVGRGDGRSGAAAVVVESLAAQGEGGAAGGGQDEAGVTALTSCSARAWRRPLRPRDSAGPGPRARAAALWKLA